VKLSPVSVETGDSQRCAAPPRLGGLQLCLTKGLRFPREDGFSSEKGLRFPREDGFSSEQGLRFPREDGFSSEQGLRFPSVGLRFTFSWL
jgi:hypothetical protein